MLTVQIGGNTSGEESARCYSERAAKVDHAGESAAMEDVEAVLSWDREISQMTPMATFESRPLELIVVIQTYRMHLLNIKLKIDSTRPGGGHAKLQQANIVKSVPSGEQTLDKAIRDIFFLAGTYTI